jgi:hypothetical protein
LRSRNPKCSRAGALTTTLFSPVFKDCPPMFDAGPGFSFMQSGTRLRQLDLHGNCEQIGFTAYEKGFAS